MSIMQRHSHGCHRLHNHIAVRLMSFVLAHRPHKRVGEKNVGYKSVVKNTAEQDTSEYEVKIDKSGYVFQLERPVPVEVLNGRIFWQSLYARDRGDSQVRPGARCVHDARRRSGESRALRRNDPDGVAGCRGSDARAGRQPMNISPTPDLH